MSAAHGKPLLALWHWPADGEPHLAKAEGRLRFKRFAVGER
ncbi:MULTISPECIES: hypothetical protein [Halomonadaceae]|nr:MULTISPECIES: hypothetical protein [Halomonas]